MQTSGVEPYASRLQEVQQRIDAAALKAGRKSEEVTLIVVSKFHSAEVVRAIHACGVSNFGENRQQEAEPKAAETADLDLNWHFVGQLQSKKARAVARFASTIHSLDRGSVVKALSSIDGTVDGFIQINLTNDAARGGVAPENLLQFAETILETPSINLLGIMAVAPLDELPRAAFERLAKHSAALQAIAPEANKISAGMTHDFEEAIEFGATHLRIGSAITGERVISD